MNAACSSLQVSDSQALWDRLPIAQKSTVILLVEDEGFLREMATGILESAGYRVFAARNAMEAGDLFRRHRKIIDVLLTDVVLPGKNGHQLANELQGIVSKLKVVFISGYADRLKGSSQFAKCGSVYLAKPFSSASLLQSIETVFQVKAG